MCKKQEQIGYKYKSLLYRLCLMAVIISTGLLNACKEDEPLPVDLELPDVFTNGSAIKHLDNGDHDNRVNMVFIGDGFAQADQQKWKDHVDDMLESLFSSSLGEPFGRYRNFFNVYRIDMISRHSGLDPLRRNTPLKGERDCKDWRAGDCQTDWERTHDAIDYYMQAFGNPEIHLRHIGLNSTLRIGGAHYPPRGWLNIYSTGNDRTTNVFLHETGHIAGFLADEYVHQSFLCHLQGKVNS